MVKWAIRGVRETLAGEIVGQTASQVYAIAWPAVAAWVLVGIWFLF
jgi:hypothetical protein